MDDLITVQREEIATLRERIRQLEALLVPEGIRIPAEWRLANAEQRVFAALTTRNVVTKEHLYHALYSDRRDLSSEPAEAVVESHVSKMRKKLRPFGVVVKSARFVGYTLVDRERYAASLRVGADI